MSDIGEPGSPEREAFVRKCQESGIRDLCTQLETIEAQFIELQASIDTRVEIQAQTNAELNGYKQAEAAMRVERDNARAEVERLQKAMLVLPGCDTPRSPQDMLDVARALEEQDKLRAECAALKLRLAERIDAHDVDGKALMMSAQALTESRKLIEKLIAERDAAVADADRQLQYAHEAKYDHQLKTERAVKAETALDAARAEAVTARATTARLMFALQALDADIADAAETDTRWEAVDDAMTTTEREDTGWLEAHDAKVRAAALEEAAATFDGELGEDAEGPHHVVDRLRALATRST